MAPNHGGDPLGSILGPMGSHWEKKNGSKPWKITISQNFDFFHSLRSSIWAKNRIYGYGAKSWWGPLGSILGPMVSHRGKKMGQNRKKLPCPQIRIFDYSALSILQKIEFIVMPNHGGDPLGSILGPMGSHWGKKDGSKPWKITIFQKFDFFHSWRTSIWAKIEYMVMAPNHGGDPLGSILGPMGSHRGKKWVKTVKRFWPIFWPQSDPIGPKKYPRASPPWFGAITVNSIFCSNRWLRSSQKFEFWGMVIFDDFDPFFWPQWDPIGPRMYPRGSPPWFGAITVNSIFCPNRWTRNSQKFEFSGMVFFYGFDPFFWPLWDPISPKMYPRGSTPWFGAVTVNSIFCPNR